MNSATQIITNADGSVLIIRTTKTLGVSPVSHATILALGFVALIFIAAGLYLLLRREKSAS